MKTLILSCNTGGGHNSASRAISEYCLKNGIVCDIVDVLSFLSKKKAHIISKGHVFLYRRLPKLFGVGYNFEEKHANRLMYEMCASCAEPLYALLQKGQYDVVVCPHVFSALMVTEVKKKYTLNSFCCFVATDYTCSPGVSSSNMDAYFIPHEDLIAEFVSCGIDADKIIVSGIPVASKFFERNNKYTTRQKLGLPVSGRAVLLCCGSMGCGPMKELSLALLHTFSQNTSLTVICGSNKRLYKKLKRYMREEPRLYVVGYTQQMSDYMDAADLYLTKAGGLSTTEAAAKGLPIVFVQAIPGCEARNVDFMMQNGYARTADTVEDLVTLVCALLNDTKTLEHITARLRADFSQQGAEKIVNYCQQYLCDCVS